MEYLAGLIYRAAHFQTRTRGVHFSDGGLDAHKLRSMVGIFHRSSVSSISVTGATPSTATFLEPK